MKVLLILTNQSLWERVRHSLLIWISTCFLGSVFLWASAFIGLKLFEIFMLSLAFSGPAGVCLIPMLQFVSTRQHRAKRIVTSLISVLILCGIVIVIFLYITRHYPISDSQIVGLLLPYVVAAPACFFLISNKMILKKAR